MNQCAFHFRQVVGEDNLFGTGPQVAVFLPQKIHFASGTPRRVKVAFMLILRVSLSFQNANNIRALHAEKLLRLFVVDDNHPIALLLRALRFRAC